MINPPSFTIISENGTERRQPEVDSVGVIRTGATVSRTLNASNSAVTSSAASFVRGFGSYQDNQSLYPNDCIQLDLYNAIDRYLESNLRIQDYAVNGYEVTIDIEKNLSDLGYLSGRYTAEYSFLRNYLGSASGHKLQVQEISSNGLEVRVVPVNSDNLDNTTFLQFFSQNFFRIPKAEVLPRLQLFKSATQSIGVFDYVQDKFTFRSFPYSIILKLTVPSTDVLAIGDTVWLAQELDEKLVESITLTPPKFGPSIRQIGPPNWDVLAKQRTAISTDYKDWDDLLSTNPSTTQGIINRLFSGSLIEGIPLNIDFKRFENFVHFGSAVERLKNFRYKVELLEYYDSIIADLTTNLNGLPSSSVSSSLYYTNNVVSTRNKRDALIGAFDHYEKYLYYESSSYVSNSYGEFYPTTWPKTNSSKPYTLYSVTSSQAQTWYDGILSSASLFDLNNQNTLQKLVPAHILDDQANDQYALFVHMIGHYFDLIYAYVEQMTEVFNRDQSLYEGFSKELIYHVAQNLGIDFENGSSIQELWEYALGTDVSGSLTSTYQISSEDRTKEIWKRIVNNLPYLLKTKGTERGVRALINCFGIPQTILRIREFGGPEPTFDSKTDVTFERFFYSTEVGTPASYSINVPWRQLTESGGSFPNTVELRVKMHPSQSGDQDIMVAPAWSVQAVDGSKLKLTTPGGSVSFTSSIYDGTFHHLSVVNNGSNITLYARKTNYGKVVSTTSGSVAGSSWGSPTVISNLQIPGTANPFSGSVQELRYWSTALDSRILDNHTLAPTSFQGNDDDLYTGSTSSFDDLAFRLTLGSDNNKINYNLTSSISSSHPNQDITTFSTGQQKIASFVNFANTASIAHVEIHSLEWPDLGANRSVGNKIRIDNIVVAGDTQLFPNSSVQRSLTDNNPPDSPRLGVYFSPTNEVNQDIAEQFGGLSIDDFIGDPANYELSNYPQLDQLRYQYYKKYKARNNAQAYIRLMRHYDAALFQLIKKLVPYRANTQVGLVIEPTILDRSKIPSQLPSYEDLTYSSSLEIPDVYTPGGFVQDGDGEPFRNMQGYVEEAVIEVNQAEYLRPGGFIQDADGEPFRNIPGYVEEGVLARSGDEQPGTVSPTLDTVDYDYVIFDETIHPAPTLGGETDHYIIPFYSVSGSEVLSLNRSEGLTGPIDLGISSYGRDTRVLGSQYTFITYATSGSGPTRSEPYLVSSSRYDYSDPFGVVVLDNRRSEVSNDASVPYDQDIFGGKAFRKYIEDNNQADIFLTGSGLQQFDFTRQYGLRVLSGTTWYTTLAGAGGLTSGLNSSIALDAFFYDENEIWTKDLLYEVSAKIFSTLPFAWSFEFGDVGSPLSETVSGDFNLTTRATGPSLVINRTAIAGTNYLSDLSVRCLNYRAQVQDYHLHSSKGMINARYEGSKLTSPDWNIDSPDTIDGGPVVTITLGGGTDFTTNPTPRGTFDINGTDAAGNPRSTGGGGRTITRGTALVN